MLIKGKKAVVVGGASGMARATAEALHERGAAEMILDQELTGEILAEKIRGYFFQRPRLEAMAAAARALGRPDAAQRIVDECCALAQS